MIGLRIQYMEGSVSAALQNKHYLLEAITETDLEAKPFPIMLNDANRVVSITNTRRGYISTMRTHQPVEVVKFIGMKKYSSDWWVANLRFESCVPSSSPDLSFLVIGWCSEKYGTKAVVLRQGSVKDVSEELTRRVSEKLSKDYSLDCEFNNIELKTGIIDLPDIPGLPDAEEGPKVSFSEILTGKPILIEVDDEEEEPAAPPSPVVKKKKKVRAKGVPELLVELKDEKTDPMDVSLSDKQAKESVQVKKQVEKQKKRHVLDLMKKRKAESDW